MSIHQENGGYVGCSYEDTQDPYWNYCVLALPLWDNGTGTLATTDLSPSPKTITNNGVTWQTTIKNFYGGASSFNGSSNYMTGGSNSDYAFGTGDWTFECWVYPVSLPTYSTIATTRPNNGAFAGAWHIGYGADGAIYVYSNAFDISGGIGTIKSGQWQHIAVSRSGSNLSFYVNGNLISINIAYTKSQTETNLGIGAFSGTPSEYLNGYLQDLKIYKGIAKYTSNFTPPTRSLVSQARRYPSGVFSL